MTSDVIESTDLICPACGYDLRAIPSERCPECGQKIDRAAMAVSTIPWVHRKAIGSVRAYWRTLILATFRMRKLGEEINRPVDLRDAIRFRWITVGIASVLPIAVFVVAVSLHGGTGFLDLLTAGGTMAVDTVPPQADLFLPFAAGITRWIVLPLAAISWLGAVSGLAGLWFHPRAKPQWQRDRALALSQYACAPLIWFSIFAAMILCGVIAQQIDTQSVPLPLLKGVLTFIGSAGVVLLLICALIYWINLLRLLGFTVQPSMVRTVFLAIGWPVACYFCVIISFGVLPWIAGYIWLVIDSLR